MRNPWLQFAFSFFFPPKDFNLASLKCFDYLVRSFDYEKQVQRSGAVQGEKINVKKANDEKSNKCTRRIHNINEIKP